MTTQFADNDGVRIAWERRPPPGPATDPDADGPPPVVLVHGLGYARWGWDGLPDRFLEAGHEVVLLDNRGIGDSDVPPGPYTAAAMAGDVVAVLDAAGLDEVALVGASLGGMVAQEVAIRWPDRIASLVLLSTTPGGPDAAPMPAATVELLAAMPTMAPADALGAAVRNALGPQAREHRPDLVDEIVAHRLASPQDPAGWQAQAHAGTTYDGGGRLGRIAASTLVLHGDADEVVAPANGRLLTARIDGARLVELAGLGHLPFWEDPARVAAEILDFLATDP